LTYGQLRVGVVLQGITCQAALVVKPV